MLDLVILSLAFTSVAVDVDDTSLAASASDETGVEEQL